MRKLNSTGSYYTANGKYWSYDTKLTDTYKGYRIFNNTFYSMTTRKHQSDCKYGLSYEIELTQCGYGDWDCVKSIQNEIDYIEAQLKTLETKRNTQKKLETVKQLTEQKEFLENLISDEQEQKTDLDIDEFETLWNGLTEKNKQHIRNGLGDNLIQTEEQAKAVTSVMKMMTLFQNMEE